MSLVDTLVGGFRKFVDRTGAGFAEGEERKTGTLTEWYLNAYPGMGAPRREDLTYVREVAKTAAPRIVIDTLLKEMRSTGWTVRPRNVEDKDDPGVMEHMELVKKFLARPNFNEEKLMDILVAFANDILEVDAGVLVRVYDTEGDLAEIYARDGASFLKNPDIYGILPDPPEAAYYQYSWKQPTGAPIPFTKDELVYVSLNNKSYSPYGWSPVQSIARVLDALNNSISWNALLFEEKAIPDGVMSILDENEAGIKRFKDIWKKEVKGKPHKQMFWNKEVKYTTFVPSAREMEFLESQQWYMKIVATAFGVSPAELGLTHDVNRATAESQSKIHIRRAIKPLLQAVEQTVSEAVIRRIRDLKGQPIEDVVFEFEHVDLEDEQRRRQEEMEDLKMGVQTINEVRARRGEEPVPWGETPYRPGGVSLPPGRQFVNQGEKGNVTSFTKGTDIKKVPEIVRGAADYAGLIQNQLSTWLKSVLKVLDKPESEWMDALKQIRIYDSFVNKLGKLIKTEVMAGVFEAERELDIDIGYSQSIRQEVDRIKSQQLNGYQLPDGQVWPGIKGMTAEIQVELGKALKEGLAAGEGIPEMAERVKGVFKVSDARASAIARTETNRMRNAGHLRGYVESGFDGDKQWVSFLDDRTTDICRRLDGQTVKLTEPFEDPETGEEFQAPPAHVNCRSRIVMIPKTEKSFAKRAWGEQGHWVTIRGKPVFISGPKVPRTTRAKWVETAEEKWDGIPKSEREELKHNMRSIKEGRDSKVKHQRNGEYTPERKKLHEKIIRKHSRDPKVKTIGNPKLIIFAGPPGAGKSTVLAGKVNRDAFAYVNSDDIKAELPEYDKGRAAPMVHRESKDIMSEVMDVHISRRNNIILDTTLGSKKTAGLIDKFKGIGYDVELRAVLVSEKTAIERVASRFKETGRFVPFGYVGESAARVRRHVKSSLDKVDHYEIYNNEVPRGEDAVLLAAKLFETLAEKAKSAKMDRDQRAMADAWQEMEDEVLEAVLESADKVGRGEQ